MNLKFIPQPRQLEMLSESFSPDSTAQIRISPATTPLSKIIADEWLKETGRPLTAQLVDDERFFFTLGQTDEMLPVHNHPEAYSLSITPQGIVGHSNTYQGILYAWQTLKQVLRHDCNALPCLRISDWPDLSWRVYHVDLKATRRRLTNLYDILPQLCELKINALLVEYEDYIRLDRHPELAVLDALTKDEIKAWVAAARDYGVAVIPLVQTLGHWQYVLGKPEYAHLQEKSGDTTTACPSQPQTWTLARDFLDEMMEIHPDAPFIHVGLDETLQLGKCSACEERLNGRPPTSLFAAWANRICSYVIDHSFSPMMWADMIESLDHTMAEQLNRDTTYVDWGYIHASPAHPYVNVHNKRYISRQWLQRPAGEIATLPPLHLAAHGELYEDLPDDERAALKPYLDNPEYPKKLKADIRLAWLTHLGLKRGGVSGIRVSYHGCIAPLFTHGQLNTITWAQSCKDLGASVLIGSSWARGHSFARTNAHPELDWYGIATLADSGWGTLPPDQLRDFDTRFAFQFFGLDDGHIGDLYYLFDKSNPRAHDVMDNHFAYIKSQCDVMMPQVKRNQTRLALFAEIADLQVLRLRAQTALLEMEYFYNTREAVPPSFAQSMRRNIADIQKDMEQRVAHLEQIYQETLIDADAKELASAQLLFFRDNLMAMKNMFFPGAESAP